MCRSLIAPISLAHPFHLIRRQSRNKHWNLLVGWCVSSWWILFFYVYSIFYYILTMYYSRIQSDWNESYKNIYIPTVGVAMTVCWMKWYWYCYTFLIGFKCIFHLCSSLLLVLWYGYRNHVGLFIGHLHPITVYRTVFGCVFWCWVSLGIHFTLSFIECYFIMMGVAVIGILYGHILHLNHVVWFSRTR